MATEMPQPKASRNSLRYVALLFFVPLAFFFCLCFLLPTRWLAARSGDPYLANLGYGASLHQSNCDIVLDGDSTAEVGLDPAIFEQQLHLKTCNIAEPDGVRVLNGNAILDQYLAQNAPPRVILFLFNAPNLNPTASPGDIGLFEGFSYRMRQPHAVAFALHHASLALKWIRGGIPLVARSLIHSQPSPSREATQGRLALEGAPRHACASLSMPAPPDIAWLNSLRRNYGNARTTVLIDVMPLADCDARFAAMQPHLKGVTDNDLTMLHVYDFLQQGPHMTTAGSLRLSQLIAQQASITLSTTSAHK